MTSRLTFLPPWENPTVLAELAYAVRGVHDDRAGWFDTVKRLEAADPALLIAVVLAAAKLMPALCPQQRHPMSAENVSYQSNGNGTSSRRCKACARERKRLTRDRGAA